LLLGFAESFTAWLASTCISALLGLLFALFVAKYLKLGYFLAFSLGVLSWVFVDVIGDSGNLDVNASFSGGWEQVIIVALFAVGLVIFIALDRSTFSPDVSQDSSFVVPLLIAVAIGIHGLGEGSAFADVAATTPITSLVTAFGGEAAGTAYVLHKFLESMVIGACWLMYTDGRPSGVFLRVRNAVLLTFAFTLPSVVAMGTGYYIAWDASYYYALGTGSLLYAILKLAGPLFTKYRAVGPNGSLKMGTWLLAGLLCVYLAALLHSYIPGGLG
jgi:hypothetical protein